MDRAQSGLRSGETGGPLREEGGPKQRPEEPLRLKMEMFICSHFTRGFPVLTMGTGHHCGDPSADTHQEPQDRRRDAKSPPALGSAHQQGRSRCQASHGTPDKMGCAAREPRVWRGEAGEQPSGR